MSVRTELRGRVLVVTLDRPEARNAFDGETIEALGNIFEEITSLQPSPPTAANGAVSVEEYRPHVIVLRAEGPVFCAGADLGDMERLGQAGFQENRAAALGMGGMFRAIRLCPAPVVARVQGPAYGGGVGLICACDVVVAGAEAKFAFSEVRLGLVAGVIAPLVTERGESPFTMVVENVTPAVANISAERTVTGTFPGFEWRFEGPFEELFRDFFRGTPRPEQRTQR